MAVRFDDNVCRFKLDVVEMSGEGAAMAYLDAWCHVEKCRVRAGSSSKRAWVGPGVASCSLCDAAGLARTKSDHVASLPCQRAQTGDPDRRREALGKMTAHSFHWPVAAAELRMRGSTAIARDSSVSAPPSRTRRL